jgi:hypothetical protein
MSPKKLDSKKPEFKDKLKSSYYLDIKTEERLVEIYLNRLKQNQRQRKSHLIDEAVALLHKKELGT